MTGNRPSPRILITGASGFLGRHLCRHALRGWQVFGTYRTTPAMIPGVTLIRADLTRYTDLKALFHELAPDAIIHTAAAAKPDFCQQHPEFSRKINTDTPIQIAGLCSDQGVTCVFTSTDLVFDGKTPPYRETDPPSPVNIYGEQKMSAESEMKKRNPHTVICRMALMFGSMDTAAVSFLEPMIQRMRAGERLDLFIDEIRTPLSGEDAATGLMLALKARPAMLHLGGLERISRYGFGRQVQSVFELPRARLRGCRQQDLTLPAPRPADVSLDIRKALSLGFRPGTLREELMRLISEKSAHPVLERTFFGMQDSDGDDHLFRYFI